MKKLLTLALATMVALSLAACSAESESSSINVVSSQAPSVSSSSEAAVAGTSYYGEVSEIVGNEITLSLGEVDLDANSAAGSDVTFEVDEDGTMPAMGMTPATPVEEGETGADDTLAEDKAEITYTGVTENIVIPAGAEIVSAAGEVLDFSAITKGSILDITMNGDIVEKVIIR